MGHPAIENETPFAFEALFAADEQGRPVLTSLVKATFDIVGNGALELAEEQIPVDFSGQYNGEPGVSSCRVEPEVAFTKLATDVVLVGHAHASRRRAVSVDVELRVGRIQQCLRVTGDRVWTRRFLGATPSQPEPFEAIPLVYERAYGGWDRSAEDPAHHGFHAWNPVGVGFRTKRARFEEGSPLPNIEDPDAMLTSYKGKSTAAGFGFVNPEWEARRRYAGTYDAAWSRDRMPLLPSDFDRRFFNAASPGLVADGFLRGDEAVLISGASPEGRLSFRLPAVVPPSCRIALRNDDDQTHSTNLDTVLLDLDARKLVLTWRSFTVLRDGPFEVTDIEIRAENAPEKRVGAPLENVVRLPGRRAA